MAYETGIASSHTDLLAKIKTFATANGWAALRDTSSELILKGVGTAGTDEIFVGLQVYTNAAIDTYGLVLRGFTGFNTYEAFDNQPGGSPATAVSLLATDMPYWLCVSSRRIVFVVRVNTIYEAAYLGFLLPYATPNQWPYPLLVGGSLPGPIPPRWSDTSASHAHFAIPGGSSAFLRTISGSWASFGTSGQNFSTWPYDLFNASNVLPCVGGDYATQPIILSGPTDVFGELDGCVFMTGFANAAENTLTIGADTYLVIPNVFRSGTKDYWGLKLA
jgi:hypothetical protein